MQTERGSDKSKRFGQAFAGSDKWARSNCDYHGQSYIDDWREKIEFQTDEIRWAEPFNSSYFVLLCADFALSPHSSAFGASHWAVDHTNYQSKIEHLCSHNSFVKNQDIPQPSRHPGFLHKNCENTGAQPWDSELCDQLPREMQQTRMKITAAVCSNCDAIFFWIQTWNGTALWAMRYVIRSQIGLVTKQNAIYRPAYIRWLLRPIRQSQRKGSIECISAL